MDNTQSIWLSSRLTWHFLTFSHAGKDVADRWYDEVKQYNFNRPGFSSGIGESHTNVCLNSCLVSLVLSHLIFLSHFLLLTLLLCHCQFTCCHFFSVSHIPRHREGCCYSCAAVSVWLSDSVTGQGETEGTSQSCIITPKPTYHSQPSKIPPDGFP